MSENENDTTADSTSQVNEDSVAAPTSNDVKEQMRLALEAKQKRHGNVSSGAAGENEVKVDSHAHGKSQRTFRRKSG